MNHADLGEALGILVGALRDAKAARLTARPGRIVVDLPEGARALDIAWTAEEHGKAMAELRDARIEGMAGSAAGDAIVLLRTADPNRRVEDLARDGVLSSLAARLLDAAVALGRNVLVAGPWLPSVELISALVGGANRPAVLGSDEVPLPKTWARAGTIAELVGYGAERIGCWSHDVDVLARLMAASSGVVGWLDARRLDRVLVRYEAAIDVRTPRAQAPLQVVAGVDVVVVLQAGVPRLREIAEITMAADGYRPQLLFSSGIAPSPLALVPLAAPTFIDELAAAGFGVLADELRAVVPRVEVANDGDHARAVSRARAVAAHIDELDATSLEPARPRPVRDGTHGRDPLGIREALRPQGRADTRSEPSVPEIPRAVVEALRHAPPPGWELDRLGDEHWAEEAAAASNAEDAAMAATFGLAPPPRPAGYKGEAVSFAELLKRAREREPHAEGEAEPLPPGTPEET